MIIREVEDPSAARLLGLAQFLRGRANDTGAQLQISTQAFINMAQNMGIDLNSETLQGMIAKAPLNGVFMPMEPNATTLQFKGDGEEPVAMPVNKAQDIVASAAKNAMKRGMKK